AQATQSTQSSSHAEYSVTDSAGPGKVRLVRSIVTRAGRIPPGDYAAFQHFTNNADAALSASLRLKRAH
ncbi:MAG TPA: hypothetical protein VN764_02250, partial [Polyangiaceae bacterium]|nr:hypothetical protein [Polyangiaceae bacterium]